MANAPGQSAHEVKPVLADSPDTFTDSYSSTHTARQFKQLDYEQFMCCTDLIKIRFEIGQSFYDFVTALSLSISRVFSRVFPWVVFL